MNPQFLDLVSKLLDKQRNPDPAPEQGGWLSPDSTPVPTPPGGYPDSREPIGIPSPGQPGNDIPADVIMPPSRLRAALYGMLSSMGAQSNAALNGDPANLANGGGFARALGGAIGGGVAGAIEPSILLRARQQKAQQDQDEDLHRQYIQARNKSMLSEANFQDSAGQRLDTMRQTQVLHDQAVSKLRADALNGSITLAKYKQDLATLETGQRHAEMIERGREADQRESRLGKNTGAAEAAALNEARDWAQGEVERAKADLTEAQTAYKGAKTRADQDISLGAIKDAERRLGLYQKNVSDYGSRAGVAAAKGTTAPTSSPAVVFSQKAWSASHPGGDLGAAIKEANRRKIPVVE
jgi:hypothetical protein